MRQARVFLVEDEALIRLMLAEMIEELEHQIVAEAGSIAPRLNPPHAEKALSKNIMIPDRLSDY